MNFFNKNECKKFFLMKINMSLKNNFLQKYFS